MKKLLCLAAVLCIACSLVGCSSKGENGSSSSSTNITVSPSPDPVSQAATPKVSVVEISADGVNIRSEANTDCEIVGEADKNERFLFKGQETGKGWYKIEYEGKEAFVSADFSSILEVEESAAAGFVGGNTESSASTAESSTASTADTISSPETSPETSRSEEDPEA